ncbi:MAG: S8 family serine peptidase [Promethearchaeota archaeon]
MGGHKKATLAGKIILGLVIASVGLGIPSYFLFFHEGKTANNPIMNRIFDEQTDRELYHWETITLNWSIKVNSTAYNYSAYLDESPLQFENNISAPYLVFTLGVLSLGNHTFRIQVTDFHSTPRSTTNSTLLQINQDADSDGDRLYDHQEFWQYLTDPTSTDSDDDGLTDGEEVFTYDTNPTSNDTDGDGICDGVELFTYSTDPRLWDTDGDGLNDSAELFIYGTTPLSAHSDGDGCDDFTEIYFLGTNPILNDTAPLQWVGGSILVQLNFQTGQPHFVPECPVNALDVVNLPRKLYLYVMDQIQATLAGNRTFYVHSLIRLDSIRILVIDDFNSTDLEERIHGTTCVNIVEETISDIMESANLQANFALYSYSVFEEERSWGTALDYAIEMGIDVISLSQVAYYGSSAYFENFSACITDYRMVICTGTGNDNRGDYDDIGVNTLRYPSLHPDTLVIGGIVFNTNSNQWERWDEGPSQSGSNWGRSFMVYNSTAYYSALELVANCERSIYFQNYYGVSWAIPKVAGIVATMLWINSYLTPSTVRQILLSTANQIDPVRYEYGEAPFPGGIDGWNAEVGYGQLNGDGALLQAVANYPF